MNNDEIRNMERRHCWLFLPPSPFHLSPAYPYPSSILGFRTRLLATSLLTAERTITCESSVSTRSLPLLCWQRGGQDPSRKGTHTCQGAACRRLRLLVFVGPFLLPPTFPLSCLLYSCVCVFPPGFLKGLVSFARPVTHSLSFARCYCFVSRSLHDSRVHYRGKALSLGVHQGTFM